MNAIILLQNRLMNEIKSFLFLNQPCKRPKSDPNSRPVENVFCAVSFIRDLSTAALLQSQSWFFLILLRQSRFAFAAVVYIPPAQLLYQCDCRCRLHHNSPTLVAMLEAYFSFIHCYIFFLLIQLFFA
jgi:hypothetical protein